MAARLNASRMHFFPGGTWEILSLQPHLINPTTKPTYLPLERVQVYATDCCLVVGHVTQHSEVKKENECTLLFLENYCSTVFPLQHAVSTPQL